MDSIKLKAPLGQAGHQNNSYFQGLWRKKKLNLKIIHEKSKAFDNSMHKRNNLT